MKSGTYIKGFAMGLKLEDTLKALNIAQVMHGEQCRKTGELYITHPIRVACELIGLGIQEDSILAAALLHDVPEDTSCSLVDLDKIHNLSEQVVKSVALLTKEKGVSNDSYYDHIKGDKGALLVKVADRCHNISTMPGAFKIDKMLEYVSETENYVLPLIRYGKNNYPDTPMR